MVIGQLGQTGSGQESKLENNDDEQGEHNQHETLRQKN